MKFLAGPKENFSGTTVSISIQDGAEILFCLELPREQDSIVGWCKSFTYLHKAQPQVLNDLLLTIPQLLAIQVDEDAYPTYLYILQALFQWTEDSISDLCDLHQQLRHALFSFEVITSPNSEYYEVFFPYPGQEKFPIHIPRYGFDRDPVKTSQVTLKKAHERDPKYIEYFINYYSRFQEYVSSADSTTLTLFTGLAKALVKLIKQENADLGIYSSFVPDICAFIVKQEADSEEQKEYLEPILSSFENDEQKSERLSGIITYVEHEISLGQTPNQANQPVQLNAGQFKDDGYRRLVHVISLVSDHYLRLYDLDSSANFWRRAKSGDPVLRFFLLLHRRPYLYLIFQLALLSIPSIYAYLNWLSGRQCPLMLGTPGPVIEKSCPHALDLFSPEFIVILALYILLVFLLFIILMQIIRKRWLYSQLLLPRLLGAAVVGLLPLLLNDQSWNIGIQSRLFNSALLALLTYIGSFIYIFIKVHNVKKFIKGHSLGQTLKESGKIFGIALSETLFIVTVTSSLIFPAVISNIGGNITNYRFGIYASTPLLSFGFFPSLIFLWTGIALFIGSFVQLLWQDQRITESI